MQAEGVPVGGIYDHAVKDWHIYVHWERILGHKAVARDGLPSTGVKPHELPKSPKPNAAPSVIKGKNNRSDYLLRACSCRRTFSCSTVSSRTAASNNASGVTGNNANISPPAAHAASA